MSGFRPLATSLVVAILLIGSGCGWHGRDEFSLRPLPYPFEAAVAVHEGDVPEVLAERGVTFVDDIEDVGTAGQNAPCSLVDRGRQFWEALVFLHQRREWRGASFFANRLLEPHLTDDGAVVYSFKTHVGRLSSLRPAMPSDVVAQVAAAVTYELKAKGGVMVLGAAGRYGEERPPHRLHGSIAGHFAAEQNEGRVLVVGLGELLRYDFVRSHIVWDAERADSGVTIHIRAIDDGLGCRWVPSPGELDGVTFYTPDPERTRVILNGEDVPSITVNPPDHTRRGSVTVHAV